MDSSSGIDLDRDCRGIVALDGKGGHWSTIGNETGTTSSDHTRCIWKVSGITLEYLAVAIITALIDTVILAVVKHGAESCCISIGPKPTGE